ncbi:MAG: tetratricopeptide repeat protein, partial [Deltaproteobacteria bacterium]|nr:tetratricopeptide repeat protein [Deltaproteobacteria bacterium]
RAAVMRLGEVLTRLGDHERSRRALVDWVRAHPNDREAVRMLAENAVAAERWDDAVDAYGHLVGVEQGDEQVAAVLSLADACDRAGRPADARGGLEQVYRRSPAIGEVRARLRTVYAAIGAHRDLAALALADAQHATDEASRFTRLCEAAELCITAGLAAPAVDALEQALNLRPGDHHATVLLADAYTAGNHIRESVSLLEASMDSHRGRRSPQLAELQHRMARVALRANDRNLQLQWLEAALTTDMQNGQVATELADTAMELGQYEVALKALRAVTLLKTPAPGARARAFLRQGMIALQQGNPRRAELLAKKALEEEPDLDEAKTFLRSLDA